MNTPCREIRLLFDGFLDRDLGRKQRSRVKKHLKGCPACRSLLAEERRVVDLLAGLPEQRCSERIIRRIEAATIDREEREPLSGKVRMVVESFHWRTVSVGVALAAVVLLLVIRPLMYREEPVQPPYNEEEVLKAQAEAEWSLAYVARKINRTERDVIEEVLLKDLPKTVRKSIRSTIPLFKGGQE